MPVGTGAQRLRNVPDLAWRMDPGAFDQLTERQELVPIASAAPAAGSFITEQLPQAGLIGRLKIVFEGTITYADNTGSITTRWGWPYNLLKNFKLSANFQDGIFNASGVDLHVLRNLRHPAYSEGTDSFPGTVGGGDSLTDATATPVYLTWDVPVSVDMVSLVGALYAQSRRTSIAVRLDRAATSELFDITGDAEITSFDGTFYIAETMFDLPFDQEGNVVLPDITRLHGFGAVETPFSNTGEVNADLIAVNGQLLRLLVQVRNTSDGFLDPSDPTAADWDYLHMEYGANKQPMEFDPVELLASINNEHYGAPLPYGYVCLDFARENVRRDSVLMRGVTDLRVVNGINSGATVSGNSAVRVVQETLFQ